MKDAEIAAVAGLAGVGLSGGFQLGLAVRSDHRERRAALRLIEDELTGMRARIQFVSETSEWGVLVSIGEPPVWSEHEAVLARHLSRGRWQRVSAAYAMYGTLRGLVSSLQIVEQDVGARDPVKNEERRDLMASATVKVIDDALRAIVPRVVRRVVRRDLADVGAALAEATRRDG
jgi:hypothetical protein